MIIVRAPVFCGLAAGPLFVASFLVQSAAKPDYDPLRHPVSSLALGPYGWVQTVTFIVAGALTVVFAADLARRAGVRQRIGAALLGIWGIGITGAGVFTGDPVSGYPPGTPAVPDDLTASGALHDVFSLPGFVAFAAAFFVLAADGWRWAVYSVASGIGFLVAFVLSGVGFDQDPALVDVAGLWQRIALVVGWTWLTLLALRRQGSPRVMASSSSAAGRPSSR